MTRVCLVGADDVELRYELLSRETAREALSTYDLRAPYANTVELETVSLGSAVSLCNDLNWYLVRFVDEALVLEPSVSDTEWLSRDLARAIRDDAIAPEESDRFLKVYGVVRDDTPASSDSRASEADEDTTRGPGIFDATDDGDVTDPDEDEANDGEEAEAGDGPESDATAGSPLPQLVEPMLVTRTGETLPEYDLRPVEETVRVRVTKGEFEA